MQGLHPLVALVVTQLCWGKGSRLLLPWPGGCHGGELGCALQSPHRTAHPIPPGTCEDVGQEPGDEVFLLLGQGLRPVPPDQGARGPGGIPRSAWCLCCGPAQAGGGCDGEDEANANLHLHGCGETEQGGGAEGLRPWDTRSACGKGWPMQGTHPQDMASSHIPSVHPSGSLIPLHPSCLVPKSSPSCSPGWSLGSLEWTEVGREP